MAPKLYFEDIEIGSRFESSWYTLSRDEIVEFAERWDPHPFHVDEAAGVDSLFGGLTACAAHLFALQSRLTHDLPVDVALLAGMGGDGLELLRPVRPGDRLRLVRRFTDGRASRSRPDRGVVAIEHVLEDPEGEAVFRTRGHVLVARRAPGTG